MITEMEDLICDELVSMDLQIKILLKGRKTMMERKRGKKLLCGHRCCNVELMPGDLIVRVGHTPCIKHYHPGCFLKTFV